MKAKIKAILQSKLLKTIVSLLLLFYLFQKTNFSFIFSSLKEVKWPLFLAGMLFLPLSLIIRAYNWGLVLNKEEKVLNLIELLCLNLVALGANLFLPASAGELVKAYYASKLHGQKGRLFISVYLDKLTSLIAIFILGTLFSLLEGFYYLAGFSFFVCLLSFLLLISPKVFLLFQRFFSLDSRSNKNFKVKRVLTISIIPNERLFLVLLVSLFGWLVTYLQLFLFCRAFSLNLSYSYLLAISSALVLARLLPFALNGLGSSEAAFIYFLGLKGVNSNVALLASLTSQLVNAFLPGLVGLALFHYRYSGFSPLESKES